MYPIRPTYTPYPTIPAPASMHHDDEDPREIPSSGAGSGYLPPHTSGHASSHILPMAQTAGVAAAAPPINKAREILTLASIAAAAEGEASTPAVIAALGNHNMGWNDRTTAQERIRGLLKEDRTLGAAFRLEYDQLKSQGRTPSLKSLLECVRIAASCGHTEFLNFFLSTGLSLDPDNLRSVLLNAIINGQTSFIETLLSTGIEVPLDAQHQMAYYAMIRKNGGIVLLLSQRNMISPSAIGSVVEQACRDGALSTLEFLSSTALFHLTPEIALKKALTEVIARRIPEELTIQITRHLFSHQEWRISPEDLELSVGEALRVEKFDVVRFLLSNGRSLTSAQLNNIIEIYSLFPAYSGIIPFLRSLIQG